MAVIRHKWDNDTCVNCGVVQKSIVDKALLRFRIYLIGTGKERIITKHAPSCRSYSRGEKLITA